MEEEKENGERIKNLQTSHVLKEIYNIIRKQTNKTNKQTKNFMTSICQEHQEIFFWYLE